MKKDLKSASSKDSISLDMPVPDLFLSEENLIALARQELKGKLPPGFLDGQAYGSVGQGSSPRKYSGGSRKKTLLASEMEARGLTAQDLCQALNLPVAEILAIHKGNTRISMEVAQKLSSYFATSLELWLE
jgi:hypothetical protein